jgi:hypothetical protein
MDFTASSFDPPIALRAATITSMALSSAADACAAIAIGSANASAIT